MGAPANRLAALERNSFFSALSVDERAVLERLLREVSIAAGELLIREGDPAREVFIIEAGEVAVLKRDPFYNPNLTLLSEDFSFAFPPRVRRRWRAAEKE